MEVKERIEWIKQLMKNVLDYPKGHVSYDPSDLMNLEFHIKHL